MQICDFCGSKPKKYRAFIKVVHRRKHLGYVSLGDFCEECIDRFVDSVRSMEKYRPEKRKYKPPCYICGNPVSYGAYLYRVEGRNKSEGKVLGHYCEECLKKIPELVYRPVKIY